MNKEDIPVAGGPATALASFAGGVGLPERLEKQIIRLVNSRDGAGGPRRGGATPIVFLNEPMLGAVRQASAEAQAKALEAAAPDRPGAAQRGGDHRAAWLRRWRLGVPLAHCSAL